MLERLRMRALVRVALAEDRPRFLAAAVVAATVVTWIAAAAGLSRVLPILLDPEVPRRAARPFLLGLLALSVEIGALVGWPLGWTEAALRSRERGEARARMALGEGPWRRMLRLSPALFVLAGAMAVGSVSWGRDARAPGRVARALIDEARRACESAQTATVVDVPLVHATWLCRPGRPPLLAGEGAGSANSIDFLASSLDVADDLASIRATDVQVLLPPLSSGAAVRMRLGEVRVRGLVPFSAPSSVPPWARAFVLVSSALVSALLATVAALRREIPRVVAWGIAVSGPAAALTALRACERAGIGDHRLALVPLAALVATLAVDGAVDLFVYLRRRRERYAPV